MKQLTITARQYAALRQGAEKRPRKPKPSSPASASFGWSGDGVRARQWNFPGFVPATANVKLRQHWSARRKERSQWATMLTLGGPPLRSAPWRARVIIDVWRPGRAQDPDNAVASVKQLVDALRSRGWLYDDSSPHLELHVGELRGPRRTQVRWSVVEERPPR